MRLWRTNDGGSLRRLLGLQPDGSSKVTSLAASHTKPATQSSDAGMLGGHVLATRGTRSCADGTVRASVVISLFEPLELATRRCDLVKLAKGGSRFWALLQHPGRSQAKQHPTIQRGLLPGLPVSEWVGRSVSGNVGWARPPTNLEFHVPTSGQCSTASCCRNWAGNSITIYQLRQAPAWMWLDNIGRCMLFRKEELMRSVHVLLLFVRSTDQSLREASNQASREARDAMDKCTMHGATLPPSGTAGTGR